MRGLQAGESLTVLLQGFLVYVPFELKAHENTPVLRMTVVVCVCEHTPYLRIVTQVIPLVVPSISVSERIGADINGAKLVARTGDVAYQDVRFFDLFDSYIRFTGQANAYFAFVMGAVPKILLVADNGLFRQSVKEETVVLLHHTEYNRAAVSVGEGRVTFPETAGKSPACRFELHFRSLATANQGVDSALYICCMFCHDEYMFN